MKKPKVQNLARAEQLAQVFLKAKSEKLKKPVSAKFSADEIKIQHPTMGHVIFPNPTLRQREILEDYLLTKKTIMQVAPLIRANVQRFNSMDKAQIEKVEKAFAGKNKKVK